MMNALYGRHRMPIQQYAPYCAEALPDWIDDNGHMNVAYYVLAFDRATDQFLDYLGIGKVYRRATGHSVFVVEAHVTYERELRVGDLFEIGTQLIDADCKRLHLFHTMRRTGGGPAATIELMTLHVDLTGPHAIPFPDDAFTKIETLLDAHRAFPLPRQLGHKLGIRR